MVAEGFPRIVRVETAEVLRRTGPRHAPITAAVAATTAVGEAAVTTAAAVAVAETAAEEERAAVHMVEDIRPVAIPITRRPPGHQVT
jgi:hypothetical protein